METRKPLYEVKNKARQQSIYLGRPGVNRIVAGGRVSFHSRRGVINENKITESRLNNSSGNTFPVKRSLGAAVGDKSVPRVSRGSRPHHPLCKGSVQMYGQNGLFLRPLVPCAVRVVAPILLQDFRNVAQLMTRKNLPHKIRQPCFSFHVSGRKKPT